MSAFILLRCWKCGCVYSFETETQAAVAENTKCQACKEGTLERMLGKLVTLH